MFFRGVPPPAGGKRWFFLFVVLDDSARRFTGFRPAGRVTLPNQRSRCVSSVGAHSVRPRADLGPAPTSTGYAVGAGPRPARPGWSGCIVGAAHWAACSAGGPEGDAKPTPAPAPAPWPIPPERPPPVRRRNPGASRPPSFRPVGIWLLCNI